MPLTNSEYVRGLNCPRLVWLDRNFPDLKPEPGVGARDRMKTGSLVKQIAQTRYATGTKVAWEDPVQETARAIKDGATCIFGAVLEADGLQAKVDTLLRDSGGWKIEKVKSSTKVKEEHLAELAFQMHVAERSGLPVVAAEMVVINNEYVWEGGPYEAGKLLESHDVTEHCRPLAQKTAADVETAQQASNAGSQPEAELNTHCKSCDYFGYCHAAAPANDILFLPGIRAKAVRELRDLGIESIDQIPESHRLPEAHRRVREAVISGKPFIGVGLKSAVDGIAFPAAFIDYETVGPAFPIYPGTRPYETICFQWSAHLVAAPGAEPVHLEFLPEDRVDPRAQFCKSLFEVIKGVRSIVHYTGFEIHRIRPMAEQGVPFAAELLAELELKTRDLHKIVKDELYLEGFRGSTSIKVVLPTLVPSMSYKEMLIGDGQAASAGFLRMLDRETPAEEAAELRRALLAYCRQDTLAMVEIYKALRRMSEAH